MNKLPKEIEERFMRLDVFQGNMIHGITGFREESWAIGEVKSFLATILEEERARLAKEVEQLKEETRAETGAFKYDDCYDAVLSLLSPSKDGELTDKE